MRTRRGVSTPLVIGAVVIVAIIGIAAFLVYSSSSTSSATSSTTPASSTTSSSSTRFTEQTTSTSSVTSSTSTSTVDPDAALYQLALKEGTVVVYGSPTAQQFANISAIFNKQYPNISVQYISLQPPQAVPRINAELASPQGYSADMALQAATTIYPLEQAGTVIPYVSSYATGFPKAVLDPLNQSTPIIELALGWVYNSQMVKPADVPTTMAQVANAKFNGLVVMNDPTTGTAFTQYWATLATVLGNTTIYTFLQNLKSTTNPTVLPTTTSCATDVAGGAHAICLGAYMQEAAPDIQAGAPEKFLNITGLPLLITPSNAAIIKNAQHPNAAKLLAD
jgi:iron(III) transport system substrate-binding protein